MSNQTIQTAFDGEPLPEATFEITCMFCGCAFLWTRPAGTPKCMEALFPNTCAGASCGPWVENAEAAPDQGIAYWRAITPPLYQDTTFGQLPDATAAQVVLDWPCQISGLLVLGATGTGKTRSVFLLLKRLCREGRRPLVFTATDFGHAVQENMRGAQAGPWVRSLKDRDLLFFDDLGKAKLTDRVEAELFGIIEARIAFLRPTVITTNMTGATMGNILTKDRAAPLIRRLRETDYFKQVAFGKAEKGES